MCCFYRLTGPPESKESTACITNQDRSSMELYKYLCSPRYLMDKVLAQLKVEMTMNNFDLTAPPSLKMSPEGVNSKVPNKLLFAAVARNESRLEQANLEDKDTLGDPITNNCCSSDPNYFLPEPIMGPDDHFEPPTCFMKDITIIASSSSLAPTKSSFRFDVSLEVAEHNATLLGIEYGF